MIVHHNYTASQKYHDIAMIKLKQIVVFTKNIKPACIDPDYHYAKARNLIIAGFGVTNVKGT